MLTTRRSLLKLAAAWAAAAAPRRSFAAPRAARPADTAPLILVRQGIASVSIVAAAAPGSWERRAGEDLARVIEAMTGARPAIVGEAPRGTPAILVGSAALAADPSLAEALARVRKPRPLVQADAIAVRRSGDRILVAGSNDESHYFAASWLLQHWGCRWYMPGAFGEHVPRHDTLSVGQLDHVHAPPFEIRHYWISWNGSTVGADEFRHLNYMSAANVPGAGQALDRYTADIAPAGGTHFNVPFAAPATAGHVAGRIEADYAAGKDISLAIADGLYANDDPRDRALITEYDRFMLRPSVTDAMLTLYDNVAAILRRRHPESRSRIGGLAYANATLPPRIVERIEPDLVMWIAPIDIDPNHAIGDPRSPPRRAYGEMLRRWARVTDGRLAIYDYDQGMLVWRDLPDPSHQVFARDVKFYRDLGILGIGTESRGAFATTFLNLFFRGQLMWDPDVDVAALLEEFYGNFYGPAAAPMRRYWGAIFAAWEATDVTEHEYPAIPAIYTPALVETLRAALADAEKLTGDATGVLADRMRFTRLGFEIVEAYVATVTAAAEDADYAAAVRHGEQAVEARLELARMNPIFTVRVTGPAPETPQGGPMWLLGEIEQYRRLAGLADGSEGRLVAKLPLHWDFKRAEPVPAGWTYRGPEQDPGWRTMPVPSADPAGWRSVRTDLYLQAQNIVPDDPVSALGTYWYRTDIDLAPGRIDGEIHLIFPGLFNEAWLWVNGRPVAHRDYREPWWTTDYRFEWDVDVSAHLRAGANEIVLRGFNPHHFAGIFRRPFLYRRLRSAPVASP
ncbi:MAG TPA: DUF4838 domain-containing protein [Allosphingosinicella sp.]|nr:DUF4838 domain-containing protein [Allosphingosinicella sp.]